MITREAVYHKVEGVYSYSISPNEIQVRLRVKKNEINIVKVVHGDRYQPFEETTGMVVLNNIASDDLFDYYQGIIPTKTRRIQYAFFLQSKGESLWYGEKGLAKDIQLSGVFQYAYLHESDRFVVPEWASDGIVYQIFPERFYNGDKSINPKDTVPWDTKPDWYMQYGGDLEGIIQKLPYLEKLGVNVLYMTPIFESPSVHKYDTIDYYKIDPHFGDEETAKRLIQECHNRGIKVIFDAVINHCGNLFFAFQDVVKNGEKSPYVDWFNIESLPVKADFDKLWEEQKQPPNYETFANNVQTMPKLMTNNPEVREYFLEVARYWVEDIGIDGWRLDVANEVDHDFWRAFRKTIKKANPNALIIGEIWHDSSDWLQGDQFDSVMNYLFRDCLLNFFARKSIGVETFDAQLTRSRLLYKDAANYSMFNLLDSHDTERFLTSCNEKEERLRLAAAFQMTYLGMPMIYYGTEVGMVGENDPDCRRGMIWDESEQNRELFDYFKKLISIRKEQPALRRGSFSTWFKDEVTSTYGFIRATNDESIGVLLNNSGAERTVTVPITFAQKSVTNLLNGEKIECDENLFVQITLAPYEVVILK